jgi:hypothetical protein
MVFRGYCPSCEANSLWASQWNPALYGIRRFSTVFTTARIWTLSWTRWIQSIPSHPVVIHCNFIFPSTSRYSTPMQWIPASLSLGVKWSGREFVTPLCLVPRSRIRGAILPLPNTPSWRGIQLNHRDNFAVILLLLTFIVSDWNLICISHLPCVLHALSIFHTPSFAHHNNILWTVQSRAQSV